MLSCCIAEEGRPDGDWQGGLRAFFDAIDADSDNQIEEDEARCVALPLCNSWLSSTQCQTICPIAADLSRVTWVAKCLYRCLLSNGFREADHCDQLDG